MDKRPLIIRVRKKQESSCCGCCFLFTCLCAIVCLVLAVLLVGSIFLVTNSPEDDDSGMETIVILTEKAFVMQPSGGDPSTDTFLYRSTVDGVLMFQTPTTEVVVPTVGETILSVEAGGILKKLTNVTAEYSVLATKPPFYFYSTLPGDIADVVQQLQFEGNVTMYPMEAPILVETVPGEDINEEIAMSSIPITMVEHSDLLWKVPTSTFDGLVHMVSPLWSSLGTLQEGDSFYSDHCTGYLELLTSLDTTAHYNMIYTNLTAFDSLSNIQQSQIAWNPWMTDANQTLHMIAKDGVPGLSVTKEMTLGFTPEEGLLLSGRECSPVLAYITESSSDEVYSYFTVQTFNNVAQLNAYIQQGTSMEKSVSGADDPLTTIGIHPDSISITNSKDGVSYTVGFGVNYNYFINDPFFAISMEHGEAESQWKVWDWERVQFTLSGESSLVLDYSLSVAGELKLNKTWHVARVSYKRFFWVELLPVYVDIKVDVAIELAVSVSGEITYRYHYSNIAPMQTGFDWKESAPIIWIASAESNNNMDKTLESSCKAQAGLTVTPSFKTEFYANLIGFSTAVNFVIIGEGEVNSCDCEENQTEVSGVLGLTSLDLEMSIIGTFSAKDSADLSVASVEHNICIDTPASLLELCTYSCTASVTPTPTQSPAACSQGGQMCGSECCSSSDHCYQNQDIPYDPLCCSNSIVTCCESGESLCYSVFDDSDGFCYNVNEESCCFGLDSMFTCPVDHECCANFSTGETSCCEAGLSCCNGSCCQYGKPCCQSSSSCCDSGEACCEWGETTSCCPNEGSIKTCCSTSQGGELVPICCTRENYKTNCCPILLAGGYLSCDRSNFFVC